MSEIPLPKDHEGREIPLDTEVLYSAKDRELHATGPARSRGRGRLSDEVV